MQQSYQFSDTIAAIATAPGRGGVGIIRVSGKHAADIAERICAKSLTARHAHYCDFHSSNGDVLDSGIALFFNNPDSFTGEDVLELQGHGGPVILDLLLAEVCKLGARMARPGEFSERAFINDKMDLAQAEAIADLIEASSAQAARNALHSLQGVFSKHVHELVESLIRLRIYVEAAIDFPEEEIDFLSDGKVAGDLTQLQKQLEQLLADAKQGVLVREGMNVVIAGKPNAGKSSLLNALAGTDKAIVTDIAGTTRDILQEQIHIDGMPLHIIDTAGLRESPDEVERIGIERAWQAIEKADRVLLLVDGQTIDADFNKGSIWPEFTQKLPNPDQLTVILNKADLSKHGVGLLSSDKEDCLGISAKTGAGLEELKQHLKSVMGYQGASEGGFTARRRHLEAIEKAQESLDNGALQLHELGAGELLAEDLRAAQEALGEITGSFTPDELLGRIFSSFCIGK
ncbi:tRNA uridine-5-carboxymethylaminomethyl(34) synthesis GTPase MnmE [Pseudoteredinibacter isoporae]|uniref:tRNA modification GTPase MnmE n=1 Tax=Pseudoteredinibacter isoporae TaxID=570281 RepID=A0A7X0JRR5_9GAMM|nr:tRNA uridine-5-carboxymethylaminomethyl(34) synthesis GTPase MnmE [Pseudoteredinibacter isoporae]MBB6520191.1 tRNA modification GTPase [Pseudoteredinibacter isoporae]NHO85763.1 tRNA uridine-5-carboxymethylaminomethyl(34) synthesis GTPase MnmE [Pseudoteredinibacter isoporae]NIB25785.1 tRNA uridine-5-carboxymethylaminomethyl(34) synthesis GTPase MnmE [Pseudoteredinibacter isoporae]